MSERSDQSWQRLDPRMLLIYPVRELVRFLPVLLGIFVAGTASGRTDWWHGLGVAIPVALGLLRYVTTYFRIADGRVELRRGLIDRHLLSTPLDRVRTVDISASPVHRLLGLTTVRIGTGTSSTNDEDHLDLDGLPAGRARRLRAELLELAGQDAVPTSAEDEDVADVEVLRLDPSWVRFAPLTSTGLVIAAGVIGAGFQIVNTIGAARWLDPRRVADGADGWSIWAAAPIALVAIGVAVSLLSIGGYAVANWGFRLTRTHSARGGAWHVRRGLLTTRETTLDDSRVRGVSISEPIGLRLAGGARATAIATGLGGDSGGATLVPPAPRSVADQVAGDVLGTVTPIAVPLTGHGPAARRRRWTRALGPAVAVAVAALLLCPLVDAPRWLPVVAMLGLPIAAGLALDRSRALGHALVEAHVVSRSGSLNRRRDVLEIAGVIGWNLRATWFQRRAGLTTLVATVAGGRAAITIPDVPEEVGVALASRAHPELLEQFLMTKA